MMRGLFVGRFQPFHLGHLHAIKYALNSCRHLNIVIGSAQRAYELDNPFTAGERIEMILRVLDAEQISNKCLLVPIPDFQSNYLWVHYVISCLPHFDVVYANTPLIIRLFSDAGFKIKEIPFFSRYSLEAKKIRSLMSKDRAWKKYVHVEVYNFIKEIGGVERIKALVSKSK
ncbi:MAG: nicotinamide-nucleotide adenylyltransferase [Candidatus Anstonellales archaeon]